MTKYDDIYASTKISEHSCDFIRYLYWFNEVDFVGIDSLRNLLIRSRIWHSHHSWLTLRGSNHALNLCWKFFIISAEECNVGW